MAEAKTGAATVLVLGGVGFIGRNFVKYLVDNKLASKIVVADKGMPATSYFHPEHKAIFDQKEIVEFKQSDLSKDAHVERVFKDAKFDYVFNLCGETRFGLSEEDYKVKCLDTATKCAQAAAKIGVKKFIEVSTAQVYKSDKSQSDEKGKVKPWTVQATYRHKAEEAVRAVAGLPSVILRPAIVYGPGDLTGITPRIVCATVYQKLKETMQFLWGASLRVNVVHVADVCAAMWLAATSAPAGKVYNVADASDLKQGVLNGWLGEIFGIKTDFTNSLLSTMATKFGLTSLAESVNEKHLPVWQKVCMEFKVNNTPLSPFIDKELLKDDHLAVNGQAIVSELKFQYRYPKITKDLIKEQINFFVQQGLFPAVAMH